MVFRFRHLKRNIERKHFTLTSKIESYFIRRIIQSYPRWVTPDLLTYSALIIGILFVPVYYLTNFDLSYIWVANLLFFFHWFTDATDGSLAIYRRRPRPNYGNYIDHTFDNITLLALTIGLGLSPMLSMEVVITALIVAYLWNLQAAYFSSYEGVLRISSRGLGSTEGRILIVLMQTYYFFLPNDKPFGVHMIEIYAWIATAILFAIFVFDFVKNSAHLRRVDDARLARRNK